VRGTSPLRDGPRLLRKIAKWDAAINAQADALTKLFVGARAGLLLNFFLFPLARWMEFSPLPPCVRTLHIAPQFCLAGLPLSKLGSVDEVIHKAFIEVMRRVFAASAPCHGISARPDAAGLGTVDPPLAPIIELPEELAPADGKAQALAAPVKHAKAPSHARTLTKRSPSHARPVPAHTCWRVRGLARRTWRLASRGKGEHATHSPTCLHTDVGQAPLLLCYFLVHKDARRLERLIAKNGLPGVEVRCFT
jgi:hypothetical protein